MKDALGTEGAQPVFVLAPTKSQEPGAKSCEEERRAMQQMGSRRAQLELERALVRIGGRELAALYRKGEYRWPR